MSPHDPAFPRLSLDDAVVGPVDDGILGSVSLASHTTKAKAIARFVAESGASPETVRARPAWARLLTRQDVWERDGMDEWEEAWEPPDDDDGAEPPDPPEWCPDDWEPDDDSPAWTFCVAFHPRAQLIWIVEEVPCASA